jgi:hypothetical protein
MLPFQSLLWHHLYVVCNSKAGEWTRRQQFQWPSNKCDRFQYGGYLLVNSWVCMTFVSCVTFFLSLTYLLIAGVRCRGLLLHLIPLSDIHTLGRTPLDEGSARRRDLYLTTHSIQSRNTSMPLAVFEPAIPASEPPQTNALDRAATAIGLY